MRKINFKPFVPHIVAIFVFICISFLYFSPEIFEGKTILGHDSRTGMGQDVGKMRKQTGEISYWSGTMFGGMPTYQIYQPYQSAKKLYTLRTLLGLELPVPVGYVFVMLLGFYILLLVFGARSDIAILGAIGYAFSSYFFILIGAGHIFKLLTLAYIPPTIAGIALAYKGKYVIGGILSTIFMSLQILSNHVQMTYYSLFVIAAYVIYELVKSLKEKTLPKFIKASLTLILAGIIAISMNITSLYHTWQYSKDTIRGKSELTANPDNTRNNGLNLDYMTQWSYGIGETWSLLIPNVKGGGSDYIGNNTKLLKSVSPQFKQAVAQQNTYWGNQPFTSGPVYAGAIFVLFFVIAMFLLKTRLKWALFVVFSLTVMLSWGQNMMWLTKLFADYFPMYTKFRAVSSMLVIAEFIIPFSAVLILVKIVKNAEIIKENKNKVFAAFALTGGFALIFAIFPTLFFNFLSSAESNAFYSQAQQNPQINAFVSELESVRIGIFRADAFRTVMFIAAAGIVLFAFVKNKIKSKLFVSILIVLCLCDMWSINKRYLNAKDFVPERAVKNIEAFFPKSQADIDILKDNDPNFRVFNTTGNPFNESNTSFYHKSIGGYHAAKLSRYADLIDRYLTKGNQNVFDMLNTKYFIVADNEKPKAIKNPNAFGNAWFVDSIIWAQNANEEIDLLENITKSKAIVDVRYKTLFKEKTISKDSASNIKLTHYKPNEIKYISNSDKKEGFAVFSEIYYSPGWTAKIDNKETEIIRCNYVLRGILIPAGKHEIVFEFEPKSIKTTETIAYLGMFAFVGFIFTISILKLRNKKNDKK